MNEYDQWLVYGMFACLLAEEHETITAEWMAVEADGEGVLTWFENGDKQMRRWLRAKSRFNLRKYAKAVYYGGGNPLTLH